MLLGLVEHDRGALNEASLEMLTLGRRLADRLGVPLHAVLVGSEARPLAARLSEYGVTTVHLVEDDRLSEYAPEAWAQCVSELVRATGSQVAMASGTDRGNEVMAHVAAGAGLPLAANCVEVEPGETYLVTRQRWGGSLLEEARLDGEVKLLTVAPHALEAEAVAQAGEVVLEPTSVALADDTFRVLVTRRVEPAAGAVSLADARVVVGGGRGVGSAEGFAALEELAELLGGAVGGSRVVTNLGWRSHADQIGQTGMRIGPDLYIACGVSGAIQHMVGCKGAKRLLAINTDPGAPIVAKADYAVIGDLSEIVPAVSAEIRKLKLAQPSPARGTGDD